MGASQADAKSQNSKAPSGIWQRGKSIPGLHSNDEEYLQMKLASYDEKMRKHAENHEAQKNIIRSAMHDKIHKVPNIAELRANEADALTGKWQKYLFRQRDQ